MRLGRDHEQRHNLISAVAIHVKLISLLRWVLSRVSKMFRLPRKPTACLPAFYPFLFSFRLLCFHQHYHYHHIYQWHLYRDHLPHHNYCTSLNTTCLTRCLCFLHCLTKTTNVNTITYFSPTTTTCHITICLNAVSTSSQPNATISAPPFSPTCFNWHLVRGSP